MLAVLLLLLLLIKSIVTLNQANYTLCEENDLFQISWVNTDFDSNQFNYTFDILGMSTRENITDINTQRTYYSTAKTEIQVGVSTKYTVTHLNRFCQDVVGDCPIIANNWTLIHKSVLLPKINLPLADIVAQHSAWTGDQTPITCLTFAPIGYQNPAWAQIFRFFPIGVAVFSILIFLLSTYATTTIDRDEITPNYSPHALQLRLPGVFQVIYYAQFIVTMGQLNLSYPRFYQLFTSDFAWSFLLLPSQWITHRWLSNRYLTSGYDPTHSNIKGTAMLIFANNISTDINGLFVTVLVYFLLLVAVCLLAICATWIVSTLCSPKDKKKIYPVDTVTTGPLSIPKPNLNFVISVLLRCTTLCYLPLTTMSIYQLILPAHWGILLAAAIVIVFLSFLSYGWIGFVLLRLGDTATILTQSATFARIGSLYYSFKEGHAKFFFYTLVYKIVTSLMVGLCQRNGTVQLSIILVAEAVYFVITILRWPYVTKQMNMMHVSVGFFRLVNIFLNITHVASLNISDYSKQCVAYTQVCFHMICFLIFLATALKNLMVIVLGTSDGVFEGKDSMPVRMMLWPRYKRNVNHEKLRSYLENHQEGEFNESDHLLHSPERVPVMGTEKKTLDEPYRRHLSVVPSVQRGEPPALPLHTEMPHASSLASVHEPSLIPLLVSMPQPTVIMNNNNNGRQRRDNNLHIKNNDDHHLSLLSVENTTNNRSTATKYDYRH